MSKEVIIVQRCYYCQGQKMSRAVMPHFAHKLSLLRGNKFARKLLIELLLRIAREIKMQNKMPLRSARKGHLEKTTPANCSENAREILQEGAKNASGISGAFLGQFPSLVGAMCKSMSSLRAHFSNNSHVGPEDASFKRGQRCQ